MAAASDVVVVGRGLIGTACARHLAVLGASVTLVGPDEPRDPAQHNGPFASHHDAGRITRTLSNDADWARLAARSIARYAAIEAASGIAFYTAAGCLIATRSGTTGETIAAIAAEHDIPAPALQGDALAQAAPMFALPPGSTGFFDPTGGTINPRAMRRAMEQIAVQHGAVIRRDTVVGIAKGRATLHNGEVLNAAHIVVATGGYAGIDRLVQPAPRLTVFPRTVCLIALTEADAKAFRDMPSLIQMGHGGDHEVYVLPPLRYPDGRLYLKIGGEDDSPPLTDLAGITAWFQSGGNAVAADALRQKLAKLIPTLPTDRMRHAPCVVANTDHGLPTIDTVSDSVTLATGGCGAAAKSADEIGRLAALQALTGTILGEGYDKSFRA